MRFLWRWTKRLFVAVVVLGVIAAVPVIWVETRCMADGVPDAAASAYQPILGAADRRNEIDTYLTYPE